MLGIGPRLNTVFQNRWKAALWSMSVLLVGYCSVLFVETVRQPETAAKAAAAQPKSPWAY